MNTQHTPEPWESGGIPVSNAEEIKRELLADLQQAIDSHTGSFGDNVMVIYRQDGARIAYLVGPTAEQNCDRIVACVNACAGIRTDALEYRAHLLKAEDDTVAKLQAKCDGLLSALVRISESCILTNDGLKTIAREAIAKARGQQL